jgi:uncharacterized cupin superfamily protein
MDKIHIDDIDERIDSATVLRPLTDAIGAENVAINYYELAPGDSFAYGYHKHEAQEEIFLVVEGTVSFETEDGTVTVPEGGAIRFAPGEYQQGVNSGAERVVAFAIGAPQDPGESEIRRECETCGDRTPHTVDRGASDDERVTRCLTCGDITCRFD